MNTETREQVLGIDFGPKHVGIALVARGASSEEVLFVAEVRLRDRKSLLADRRALRRGRRGRKRYRQPKIPQRGGGATSQSGEESERGRAAAPEYRRATGLNTGRRRCKFVDPQTGEICGWNTPRKANVRDLLLWNICRHLPVSVSEQAGFLAYVNQTNLHRAEILGALPAEEQAPLEAVFSQQRRPKDERLKDRLRRLGVDRHLRSQVTDIVGITSRRPLSGRLSFCREHFLRHHEQSRVPRPSVWLPNTVEMKQADVLKVCRQEVAPRWRVDCIVLERANFDLQLLRQQTAIEWSVEDWQRGPRWGYRNTFEAKKQEQGNRCAYCGSKPTAKNRLRLELEHVIPGGGDTWENLVLSCRKCNEGKGNRSPAQAGMRFWTDTETGETLSPAPLGAAHVSRYMTQTDQGWRRLQAALQQVFPQAAVEHTWGYVTSFYRNRWNLPKKHFVDAAVIASSHELERPVSVPEQPQRFAPTSGGKQLFDTNPLSKRPEGRFAQSKAIVCEQGTLAFKDVAKVENPRKRATLQRVADEATAAAKARGETPPTAFTAEMLPKIPFKSVRLAKQDASDTNTRRLGRHWFKVASAVNIATIVYQLDGKVCMQLQRNPAVFRHDPGLPQGARVVATFRKGDLVECDAGRGRVTKNHSNCTLTVELLDSGKEVTRLAKSFRPRHG